MPYPNYDYTCDFKNQNRCGDYCRCNGQFSNGEPEKCNNDGICEPNLDNSTELKMVYLILNQLDQ